ncbi:MAG: bifunctional diaminohydroxyphosphoribosylaminopyrimidine deaminase/5-amino-6-(5-phosphoribosylamino)uracil reductase RibD, partial [Acidimicrobiales bacterium]
MTAGDSDLMSRALELAASARSTASPNPWVGCVVTRDGDTIGEGATAAPGGPHAEITALLAAGSRAGGATLYTTLEPCGHYGRTGPCADSIVEAGVRRVVVSVMDPDALVSGRGLATLRAAGLEVVEGVLAEETEALLAPYLKHRRTGRPYVVLKLAATIDGRIAAPDGSSKWITGATARADVHELRGESDAVLVGAGTIRADDPLLTARPLLTGPGVTGPEGAGGRGAGPDGSSPRGRGHNKPLRVVLGRLPPGARAAPALEISGDLRAVLDELGRRAVLQLLVEGGSRVAGDLHRLGLVDRYVIYLAAALLGGADGVPMFAGSGAATMSQIWR